MDFICICIINKRIYVYGYCIVFFYFFVLFCFYRKLTEHIMAWCHATLVMNVKLGHIRMRTMSSKAAKPVTLVQIKEFLETVLEKRILSVETACLGKQLLYFGGEMRENLIWNMNKYDVNQYVINHFFTALRFFPIISSMMRYFASKVCKIVTYYITSPKFYCQVLCFFFKLWLDMKLLIWQKCSPMKAWFDLMFIKHFTRIYYWTMFCYFHCWSWSWQVSWLFVWCVLTMRCFNNIIFAILWQVVFLAGKYCRSLDLL